MIMFGLIWRLQFSCYVSSLLSEGLKIRGGRTTETDPTDRTGQWGRTDRDSSSGTESPGTAPKTRREQRSTQAVVGRFVFPRLNSALRGKERWVLWECELWAVNLLCNLDGLYYWDGSGVRSDLADFSSSDKVKCLKGNNLPLIFIYLDVFS